MKTSPQFVVVAGCLLASASLIQAAIIIPGANGTDGPLNITQDTVIDLSKAVTANWDANNAANAGKGVYDSNKWAVVFKYTDVTIAAGATVTFKNHASRAPVVWLVSGSATIAGTLSLDGERHQTPPRLAEPGPGGFRGGNGWTSAYVGPGAGFGIGGGASAGNTGGGGSYSSTGGYVSGPTYGNPSLVPLIGGSGGAGCSYYSASGGAGGGAILIAVANSLTVDGNIRAAGGVGFTSDADSRPGSGSGGGIRIVSGSLAGTGTLNALGGAPGGGSGNGIPGGLGRIRIERVVNDNSLTVTPDPSVVGLQNGAVALMWPPEGAPEVRVVSVGGKGAPVDPRAEFGTVGADVILPQTASVDVLIETTHVEEASEVFVRGTPRSNASYTEVKATKTAKLSDNPLVVRWTAALPVNVGYAAVQVRVVRP